jgi:pimeloyl-ACP methyl ester carboxylesterase
VAVSVAIGLCERCVHQRSVRSARGSTFVLCDLHRSDPRFAKYPRLPIRRCAGYAGTGLGASMTSRTIDGRGVRLQVQEQGEGPLVLLLHGFPESAHSWRHQMPALAEAGYRAVAPNQRGYAGSDRPEEIEAYDIVALADDALAVLDAYGAEQAIVVGHDWGAIVAWHLALLHPQRVRGVAAMSVPYNRRSPAPPLAILESVFKDTFFYILYFQAPGVAEAELEADVRKSLRSFYGSASGDAPERKAFLPHAKTARLLDTMPDREALPSWLGAADLELFTAQFEQSGFRGPINWYRNFDRNWERTPMLADAVVQPPALFIAGERDPVIAWQQRAVDRLPQTCRDLRGALLLPGAGHWIQQERPAEVNAALLRFIAQLA